MSPRWRRGVLAERSRCMHGQYHCLRGINIQESWAQRIYDGEKTVEARTWEPGCYSGENWLIETPDKPKRNGKRKHAEITGTIRFGAAHEYANYKEWRSDFERHRVEEGSKFDWRPDKQVKMYGWEILQARQLAYPVPAPPVRGMIGTREHKAWVVFKN